jgi:hypothetical protein
MRGDWSILCTSDISKLIGLDSSQHLVSLQRKEVDLLHHLDQLLDV